MVSPVVKSRVLKFLNLKKHFSPPISRLPLLRASLALPLLSGLSSMDLPVVAISSPQSDVPKQRSRATSTRGRGRGRGRGRLGENKELNLSSSANDQFAGAKRSREMQVISNF